MRGKFKQLPTTTTRNRTEKEKIKKSWKDEEEYGSMPVSCARAHPSLGFYNKKKPVRRKWKWKKRKIKGENNKILNFLIWRCCCNCRSRPKEHTRYQMGGKTTSRWQRWMCQLTTTPKKKEKEKKNLPLGNCLFQINNFCISSSSPCTPYQTIFNTRQSSILCLVLPVSSSCPLSFHGPPNTMAQLHPSNPPTQPPKKKNLKRKRKKVKEKPQGPSNKSRASRETTENNVNYDIAPSLKIQLEKIIIKNFDKRQHDTSSTKRGSKSLRRPSCSPFDFHKSMRCAAPVREYSQPVSHQLPCSLSTSPMSALGSLSPTGDAHVPPPHFLFLFEKKRSQWTSWKATAPHDLL